MSALQERAVQMIGCVSDDNVSFLIEIIQRLMPQKAPVNDKPAFLPAEGMRAFDRLNEARLEIRQYLPEDFDPDREREEALAERYRGIKKILRIQKFPLSCRRNCLQ